MPYKDPEAERAYYQRPDIIERRRRQSREAKRRRRAIKMDFPDPAYERRRKAGLRAFIRAQKKDRPCVDCGRILDQAAMHFDHVRGTKLFGVAAAPSRGIGIAKIKAEIAKCELRCNSCHSKRHADLGHPSVA